MTMNLQDQVLYRCVHGACARPLPRKVNFCPYCGTAQQAALARPVSVDKAAQDRLAPPVVQAPVVPPPPSPPVPPAPAPPVLELTRPAPPAPAPRPMPRQAAPAAAAAPPGPRPIRLRYWLLALAMLGLIWFYAKPGSKKLEARIEKAIAQSADCQFNDAQAELIALREDKATPAQLQRLQSAINGAVPACEKKRVRARMWSDTQNAVNGALDEGDPARAQVRLSQFTKRYGDDADTRALKAKIVAQREAEAPPAAPRAEQKSLSARNLINEAERELERGNYKAASDKLETCIAMIEGSRECVAYKAHADGLLRDMQRCISNGRTWSSGRCM